jgi:signal transduction histidine kinase/CheY-like chemotaxis protein
VPLPPSPETPASEHASLQDQVDHLTRLVDSVADANAWAAQLMAELEETQRTLAERNRDLETQQRELRDALLVADAANAAKEAQSRFLSNMSHEIRTPLNGIIGMCQLFADSGPSELQRSYVQTMQTSADALLSLVNDLLDLAKIESGHFTLEQTAFSIVDLVESTVQIVAAKAHQKGVAVAVDTGDVDLADTVVGDPGRLRQLLLNLLGTAVKFTDRGEIVVSLRSVEPRGASTVFRCSVRDTGIGIPYAHQGTIFRPFRQADASTSRQFGGTGLGLSIARELASLMGGELGLASEPGVGSDFWFTVVLDAPAGLGTEHPRLDPIPVWIVDRHAATAEAIASCLRRWGAMPVVYSTEPPAWPGGPVPPAVVLVDETWPEGETLLRAIARAPGRPRVVLLQALGAPPGRKAVVGIPAARLEKPIRQAALLSAMRAASGVARGPQPAQAGPIDSLLPGKPHVLVVEDNPVNQLIASHLLRKLGAVVTVAGDGHEAVELTAANRFDLIVMDCQMPGLDGYDATRLIRAREQGARTPIIALTAHAMLGDREQCLAAGMDAYLTKPIHAATLRQTLQQLLGDRPVA